MKKSKDDEWLELLDQRDGSIADYDDEEDLKKEIRLKKQMNKIINTLGRSTNGKSKTHRRKK